MRFRFIFQAVLAAGLLLTHTQALPFIRRPIKEVISEQEAAKGIPEDLLKAIAKVESGFSPWAVNAKGRSYNFSTKKAAVQFIKEMVRKGFTNFSVGCMQLHYASHRGKFKSVEAMLEPENNVAHAAKLIKYLERRTGSMERAVKLYHSPTPAHHNPYKRRVYGMWAKMRGGPESSTSQSIKTAALNEKTTKKSIVKTTKVSSKAKKRVQASTTKKNIQNKI